MVKRLPSNRIVVDNQTVGKLANQQAGVTNPAYRNTIRTIWHNLGEIVADRAHCKARSHDAVSWRRREWNTGADAAANLALKTGQKKNLSASTLEILNKGDFQGLQVHVDSGFNDGVAACGVTFTTWSHHEGTWTRKLLGHSYAGCPGRSAFHAESRALAAATDIVRRVITSWNAQS